ncbi:MAG: hypothetical protein KY463_03210, partial [Actinobacteria bacterium]|nr:hypothetical protein [Actinomycetota bacterium]
MTSGAPGVARNPFIALAFGCSARTSERFYAAAARRMVELTTARLEGRRDDVAPRAVDEIPAVPKTRSPL